MLAGLVIVVLRSVFRFCSSIVGTFYFGYFRATCKGLLHRLSSQCEIERILSSSELSTAAKIRQLEFSLRHSSEERLKKVSTTLSAMESCNDDELLNLAGIVMEAKQIENGDRREWLELELVAIFRALVGYRFLVNRVEKEWSTLYNSENQEHEQLLLKLWSILKPNDELKDRISPRWTAIGFQGNDPAADFRDMGILGLQQLVYFSESRGDRARQVLSNSNHPAMGYPFAVVGISMTSLARDFLREGALRNIFFNNIRRAPQLEDFHRIYCDLFESFDCHWRSGALFNNTNRASPTGCILPILRLYEFGQLVRKSVSGEISTSPLFSFAGNDQPAEVPAVVDVLDFLRDYLQQNPHARDKVIAKRERIIQILDRSDSTSPENFAVSPALSSDSSSDAELAAAAMAQDLANGHGN